MHVTKNHHIYKLSLVDNNLLLEIINKNISKRENFKLKIMYDNKEAIINLKGHRKNKANLGNITQFHYTENTDNININNKYLEENFDILFPNFNHDYYISNNKLINNTGNTKYIMYHWYLCGQYHPYILFKYILKKYENIILNIKYPILQYCTNKTNTLLFIDDRYDPSFPLLLILFLYSVDNNWNITIFTTNENKQFYENDLNKLRMSGKINILNNVLKNNENYSKLLKDHTFWESIKEENCLLFQYDSFSMGKFNKIFLNYTYIGARWPHNASSNQNIKIGNGGTSFRKTRIMESISKKFSGQEGIEDVFFAEKLYKEKMLNCTDEIADNFAFENIFNNDSIYGHQIYNSVKLSDIDSFMYNKIINMV